MGENGLVGRAAVAQEGNELTIAKKGSFPLEIYDLWSTTSFILSALPVNCLQLMFPNIFNDPSCGVPLFLLFYSILTGKKLREKNFFLGRISWEKLGWTWSLLAHGGLKLNLHGRKLNPFGPPGSATCTMTEGWGNEYGETIEAARLHGSLYKLHIEGSEPSDQALQSSLSTW